MLNALQRCRLKEKKSSEITAQETRARFLSTKQRRSIDSSQRLTCQIIKWVSFARESGNTVSRKWCNSVLTDLSAFQSRVTRRPSTPTPIQGGFTNISQFRRFVSLFLSSFFFPSFLLFSLPLSFILTKNLGAFEITL